MREVIKKCNCFLLQFSSTIDWKLSLKVGKSMRAWKFDKKSVPGRTFWAKDWFLVHFWIPAGSQNWYFLASNAFNFSKEFYEFFKGGLDRCSEAPGASQGPSRDLPGTLQGTLQVSFLPFSSNWKFELFFDYFVSSELPFFFQHLVCFLWSTMISKMIRVIILSNLRL